MTHPETSTKKPRCHHISKIGARCHADVQTGKSYCFFHDPDQKSKQAQARKEGGEARSREADAITMPPGLPVLSLETPSDVGKLLAETVNQFRRREIDLRAAKAIANMATLLLRTMKEAAQEQLPSAKAGHHGEKPHLRLNITGIASDFNSQDRVSGATLRPSTPGQPEERR